MIVIFQSSLMRRSPPPPPQVSPSPPQTVLVFEPLLSSCLEFQGRKGLTFLTQAVMSENLV